MQKTIVALIALAVVGLATYYLVFKNNSEGNTTTSIPNTYTTPTEQGINMPSEAQIPVAPVNTQTTTVTPAVSALTINIKGFAFNPTTVTIKKGTKVTWINNDSAPHTVTSDSGNLLDSPTLASGQSFSFTFASTGTTNYHCAIHTMMKGQIVVEN